MPQPSSGNPLERFSLPARLVIMLGLVVGVGGTAAYIASIYDDLAPGRYPVWLFAAPVLVFVGAFCLAALALLRAAGVPIYRPDDEIDSGEDDQDATNDAQL
jgi:hypothetical protein